MKYFKGVAAGIGPIVLAWALGLVTLPDSTYFLDYSSGGSELLNLSEELKKEVTVLVGKDEKESLSLYNVQFKNRSSRHYGEMEVSFAIEPKDGTELIASALQGPEDYSNDSIRKKPGKQNEVNFIIDHINRAGNQPRNYFTASFLFSGAAPEVIKPISHEMGVVFRPASENRADASITYGIFACLVVVYISILWWAFKRGSQKREEKSAEYKQKLNEYLVKTLPIDSQSADTSVQEIENIRDKVYCPPGFITRYIRGILKEYELGTEGSDEV